MEQTREYRVTIEIYRDTNKATYRQRYDFDSVEDAREWLAEYADEES